MPPGHALALRRRRQRWWKSKRANETAVERETRLQKRRDWRFHHLLNEPLEDRFFRHYIDRIHAQDRRKSETPEERAARTEKCRLRARERRMQMQTCSRCGKSYRPHQLTKCNGSSDPLLQELRPTELMLCNQCHRISVSSQTHAAAEQVDRCNPREPQGARMAPQHSHRHLLHALPR